MPFGSSGGSPMESRSIDPVVMRRRLCAALRKSRERAGFTQRDVAREMDWSLSKLIRIESGVVSISTTDLRVLLAHYRITDADQVQALIAMSRAARHRSGWTVYSDVVSPQFLVYLAHESSASVIRSFEPLLVPGLLQTADYAKAAMSRESVTVNEDMIQRRLELRQDRQELLLSGSGTKMFFIVDEAVIRRVVGGPEVMRGQLRRLLELVSSSVITLYVVPFSAGFYPLLRVPSVLLEFEDPDVPGLLYVENSEGESIMRDEGWGPAGMGSTRNYLDAFFETENAALDHSAARMIDQARADLGHA